MRPEYGFLPAAHRERARIAKPGTMFVSQPQIPVPLVAEFPFPAWATRPDEVRGGRVGARATPASDAATHASVGASGDDGVDSATEAEDPFAGLPNT
jgi:hypothetical protein